MVFIYQSENFGFLNLIKYQFVLAWQHIFPCFKSKYFVHIFDQTSSSLPFKKIGFLNIKGIKNVKRNFKS